MPYSGPDDPDLPDYVAELSESEREQWVNVFNSAEERCQNEGLEAVADNPDDFENCEAFAFANANGVVVGEERNVNEIDRQAHSLFTEFWRGIRRLFQAEQPQEQLRAMAMPRLYGIVDKLLYEEDNWPWLMDIYADDGALYALTVEGGKLYRYPVTVQGETVTLGERVQVMESHPPVTQSRTVIRQQADGRWRWFSISATAVLNRVGEIDSRDLFDSFVAHAEASGEYPIRQFYHQGAALRTGQADFLARDGYCYITSGLFDDDSDLARAEIEARQREPDYWGESIGFLPTAEPELVEVAEGINIPAYAQGINREISTLPEREAASLFTVTSQEVQRMAMTGSVWDAFLKLWDDDEDAARRWLEEHPEARNRSIEEAGLITRDQETGTAEETPPAGDETSGEAEDTSEGEAPEVVLDDEAVEAIAARMLESEGFGQMSQAVAAMCGELEQATSDIRSLGQRLDEQRRNADERLQRLEREDDEKQREWVEDLPAAATGSQLRVSYRPRNRAPEREGDEEGIITDGPEALSAWEEEKKQKNMPSY